MPDLSPIDELPGDFAALARDYRAGALALARSTVPNLIHSPFVAPPMFVVRAAAIDAHFYITAEHDKVVFFFHRDRVERVVLDASVSFELSPSVILGARTRLNVDQIRHFAVAPPFLATDLTLEQLRPFAAALDKPAGEFLVLRLPEGWFAVADPESEDDARIAWRPGPSAGITLIDRDSASLALPVFLSLARSIGEWVSVGFERGPELALDAATVAGRAPVIHQIFRAICDAWCQSWNEVGTPDVSIYTGFVPDFEVRDYQGAVLLRVKPDGTLATDDEDDPFQLLLTVALSVRDGQPRSRIGVGPPDFLVSGSLHDLFFIELMDQEAFDEVADQLGLTSDDDRTSLRSFILSALARSLVFRVRRRRARDADLDRDVIIYSAEFDGAPASLVVRADFKVGPGPQRTVEYQRGTQQVVFSSLPIGDPVSVPGDLVRYGLRLLAALRDWIGVLQ